ncbi:MAG: hypothetical protein ACLFNQ_01070 [Spirochaetaceae bacterium]
MKRATMQAMLIEVLVGLTGILMVILLWPALKGSPSATRSPHRARSKRANHPDGSGQRIRRCPVCHAQLSSGERIRSVVFSGGTAHREIREHTTHIFGCPHCYPHNNLNPRQCPVCEQTLSRDGYLIARMFQRPGKKDHVHVLGCTECRSGPRRSTGSRPRNIE